VSSDPTAPSPTPPVRRLNRGVWIVAALILLITVCVIGFLVTPKRGDKATVALPSRPLTGSDPGFLHHPPGEYVPPPATPSEPEYLRSLIDRQAATPPLPPGVAPSGPSLETPPGPVSPSVAAPAPVTSPADPRREAFLRALEAPLTRSSQPSAGAGAGKESAAPPWLASFNPPSLPSGLPLTASTPEAPAPPGAPAGRAEPPTAGSSSLLPRVPPTETPARYHPAPSASTIPAGTVIPALLLTEVNSDLPGHLLAQVSRNVYDGRQATLLIPQGARLLGRYENQVAVGQRRLLVAWTRLIYPDGSSYDLPGLPGTSPSGAAGVGAHVQNHLLQLFGDAILLSLFSAGAQLSQPQQGGFGALPGTGSVAAAALGQELSSVGLQLLRRDISIQPTLRLPAATPFAVFVNADLELGRFPLFGDFALGQR
jgi:type IV secretory pathway VirB10-like protein